MRLSAEEDPARKHEALVDIHMNGMSRRNFVKGAATMAAVAAAVSVKPMLGGKASVVEAAPAGSASNRSHDCFNYRKNVALAHKVNMRPRADNGDAARFTDFSWCYNKGLPHDNLGIPNPQAMLSLKNALTSGKSADFANIIVGTPRGGPNSKLTGPQAALAFDLEGMDSHSTVIPPPPNIASAQTAAEQVEHYWAALLADVPFTEYETNTLVGQAVTDMNNMSFLSSPANNQFPYPVTRQNLFRGQFVPGDGNLKGPYLSQFMIQPTFFGSQPINQQHKVFLPVGGGGSNYLTSVAFGTS
ncbi:MAG TPA: twin-arginine translocation signal domain-containing protein [Anaerolineales bacterium]|nr:twin-arginine translocation signal domain-containing protein [Anaerolineales bacterium]